MSESDRESPAAPQAVERKPSRLSQPVAIAFGVAAALVVLLWFATQGELNRMRDDVARRLQLAELEIAAPFIAGKINLTKVERGQTAKLICTLEQKVPFSGNAVARLVGLPANTTASDVEITQENKEAIFEVVTTEKSPLGSHKNVFCQVTLTRDGEPITHLIAQSSVLRIDAARPKPAADNKPVAQTKTD